MIMDLKLAWISSYFESWKDWIKEIWGQNSMQQCQNIVIIDIFGSLKEVKETSIPISESL